VGLRFGGMNRGVFGWATVGVKTAIYTCPSLRKKLSRNSMTRCRSCGVILRDNNYYAIPIGVDGSFVCENSGERVYHEEETKKDRIERFILKVTEKSPAPHHGRKDG
jgi:hypothetical protein